MVTEKLMTYGTFVRINGLDIHAWEMGIGSPILLIHGFMGTTCDWRFNVPRLSKRFSVHAFDLTGFGYSEKPLDFNYTSDGYADFVRAFLIARNIRKAVLAGNSLGGQIALKTCLKYPDSVAGLVLIDSGSYPGSVQSPVIRSIKIPVVGELIMALVSRTAVKAMLRTVIFHDGSFATDDVIDYYYKVYKTVNARRIPPIVVRNMVKDEPRISAALSEIKCPTLVLWGAQDRVISPLRAKSFTRDIINASALIIDHAGHMPQVEKAETVNNAIIDFVTKHC